MSGIRLSALAVCIAAATAFAWEGPTNVTSVTNATGDFFPDLAADSQGNVHLVYCDDTWNIRHRIRYTDNVWSATTRVSTGQSNTNWVRCAMDKWDNLHVAWHNGSSLANDEVYYRKRFADGTWGSIVNLSNSGGVASIYPDITVDGLGRVFVAWHEAIADGGDNWEVVMAVFDGAAWSPYQVVGGSNQIDAYPVLACDAANTIHIAYTYDYQEIYYRSRSAAGAWSAVVNISNNSGSSRDPHIAVSPDGTPHVVWHDNTPGNWEYFYATKVGGAWAAPVNVSNNSGVTDCYGAVAVAPNGSVHIVWLDYTKIYYASKPAGGVFAAPATLASQDNARGAVVLADGADNIHVTWQGKSGGLDWDVYCMLNPAVTYPRQANFVSASLPTQVVAGQLVTASVTLKNTGTTTWTPSTTRLGTFRPRDRASAFYNPADWLSAARPTGVDATTAPGQNGTFTFIAKAPAVPGQYSEYFELLDEGLAWFDNTGDNMTWNVTVVAPPSFDLVAMSSPTLVADGSTQYTLTLKVTDQQGMSDLKGVAAMLNRNWTTPSATRGYLSWGQAQADVTYFGYSMVVQGSAAGGGYWGFDTSSWGSSYISPVSCSTAVAGNQRTIVWTIRVQPAWGTAGPMNGNFIGMSAHGVLADSGWQDSTALLGYTFNVSRFPPPPADFDGDGDVDGADFGLFSGCFNGTGNPIRPDCVRVDLNGDACVDGQDYGLFAACFNGSGNASPCR